MAFSAVNSWGANSGGSTVNTLTATVSGTTANNLLIGAVTTRNTSVSGSFSAAGYTLIGEVLTGNTSHAWFYRYATGTSADNFVPSWSSNRRASAVVSEFSGLATSSVLEASNENEANVTSGSLSTAAGSITPTTAGVAITTAGWEYADWGSGGQVTIDSGFTLFAQSGDPSNFRGRTGIGYKDLSSTASVNPTWTGNASGANYVAVAAFKEAAGGTTITADGVAFQLMHNQFSPAAASRLNGVLQ